MQLTIDLPEPAFQRLSRLAELTNRPLSELAIQSIAGNLPPEIATTPVDIQAELLAMQKRATHPRLKPTLAELTMALVPPALRQQVIAENWHPPDWALGD